MPAGAVAPTEETIKTGQYKPLSRPLFVYARTEALELDAVRKFRRPTSRNAPGPGSSWSVSMSGSASSTRGAWSASSSPG